MTIDRYKNKVVWADCLQFPKRLPDGCVDLIFADPPFNLNKEYDDNRNDYQEWCYEWIRQGFRLLKDSGSFYLMTIPRHLEWKMPIMATFGIFINLIRWRNVSAASNKRCFWGEYQPIMLYGKTKDYVFNTYAEIKDSGIRRWGGYTATSGFKGQMLDSWDDIRFVFAGSISHPEAILKSNSNQKVHPCQMPIGLAERVIRFSSNESDIVLDPFSGIFTTAIACIRLKRNFICIEKEFRYCKIGLQRIKNEVNQLRLF